MVKRDASRPTRGQRGMVTIELAIGLLALGLLTVFLGWLVQLGALQVRCIDTAAQVARHVSRGDVSAARLAERNAPPGAVVSSDVVSGDVRVRVRVATGFFGIGAITIEGVASSPVEPGLR